MSQLIFIDSFDHYATVDANTKWTLPNFVIAIGQGRNGTNAAQQTTAQSTKTFGPEFENLTMGVAYNTAALSNSPIQLLAHFPPESIGINNIRLTNVGTGKLGVFCSMISGNAYDVIARVNGQEIINGRVGTGTGDPTSIVSNDVVIGINQWYFLELQAIHVTGAVGACPFTGIGMESAGGGSGSLFDDLYVTDDELLGDHEIRCLYPDADGDFTQWTPLVPGDNYLMTMEHPPDENTTYIYSSAAGLVETQNLDDITGFAGNILGAQALTRTVKSETGDAQIRSRIRDGGGTDEDYPADFYPSAISYRYDIRAWRKSPFTGVDFTVSEINALQLGKERTV